MSGVLTGDAAIGVIGAGAWGTALATMLAADGTPVALWARSPALADEIASTRINGTYLPGVTLAPTIAVTSDLAQLASMPVLLVVCPAQHVGTVLSGLPASAVPRDLVLCAKGIEAGTGRLMADVTRAAAPGDRLAVLSGPTFAREVATGLPTAITLACEDGEPQWKRLSAAIARPAFRPIIPTTSSGPRSAGRSRMCWRLPAAWSRGWGWARMPARRSSRAAMPRWRALA
jgi:glycerol-3-phosphate dehydrogenase (NAD(P)+)